MFNLRAYNTIHMQYMTTFGTTRVLWSINKLIYLPDKYGFLSDDLNCDLIKRHHGSKNMPISNNWLEDMVEKSDL